MSRRRTAGLATVGYLVLLPNLHYREGRGSMFAAAARFPDRVAAAASFYGTWLVSDAAGSPHLTLGKARGELYIACAEHDDRAPLPMVAELKRRFDASGARGELEIYPDVRHGFGFPQHRHLRQAGRQAALAAADCAVRPQPGG